MIQEQSEYQAKNRSLEETNKKYYEEQKQKHRKIFENIEYSRTEHPELISKYEGYLQISRKKLNQSQPTEYFSSPFIKDLKEKRNNMFSDQIIDRMQKSYKMPEYSSNADWHNCVSSFDAKQTKFAITITPEIDSYQQIEKKMLRLSQ